MRSGAWPSPKRVDSCFGISTWSPIEVCVGVSVVRSESPLVPESREPHRSSPAALRSSLFEDHLTSPALRDRLYHSWQDTLVQAESNTASAFLRRYLRACSHETGLSPNGEASSSGCLVRVSPVCLPISSCDNSGVDLMFGLRTPAGSS